MTQKLLLSVVKNFPDVTQPLPPLVRMDATLTFQLHLRGPYEPLSSVTAA